VLVGWVGRRWVVRGRGSEERGFRVVGRVVVVAGWG